MTRSKMNSIHRCCHCFTAAWFAKIRDNSFLYLLAVEMGSTSISWGKSLKISVMRWIMQAWLNHNTECCWDCLSGVTSRSLMNICQQFLWRCHAYLAATIFIEHHNNSTLKYRNHPLSVSSSYLSTLGHPYTHLTNHLHNKHFCAPQHWPRAELNNPEIC